MKTITENYAADLPHADALCGSAPLMLEAIACDLRALYSETASALPDRLLSLAHRIDDGRPDEAALAA